MKKRRCVWVIEPVATGQLRTQIHWLTTGLGYDRLQLLATIDLPGKIFLAAICRKTTGLRVSSLGLKRCWSTGCKGSIRDPLQISIDLFSSLDKIIRRIQHSSKLIRIGEASLDHEAYALGWARTKLPAQLSVLEKHDAWLGHNKVSIVEKKSAGKIVMHHHGNLVGILSSVFFIPENTS